ncbi:unnamed protein product [Dracunculus medinensis]|uniref:Serum response factor homolog n=1 Tax=Dracunculus medinensis TaxID=318479 RepID=A0A0N4U0L5_DRAME|nr:unnamed protein product [Dracunculus medinensis]
MEDNFEQCSPRPQNHQHQIHDATSFILINSGRVKIKMEYIGNKLRRYTTFSKRKTGIMKKAYELSTLTGTQVMLLVASETGHVYTFATKKLQPMISSEAGKTLIQNCLNTPDLEMVKLLVVYNAIGTCQLKRFTRKSKISPKN